MSEDIVWYSMRSITAIGRPSLAPNSTGDRPWRRGHLPANRRADVQRRVWR